MDNDLIECIQLQLDAALKQIKPVGFESSCSVGKTTYRRKINPYISLELAAVVK